MCFYFYSSVPFSFFILVSTIFASLLTYALSEFSSILDFLKLTFLKSYLSVLIFLLKFSEPLLMSSKCLFNNSFLLV